MMMEHTQDLLVLDQYGNVNSNSDQEKLFSLRVRGFTLSSGKAAEENTRRIVACWNACKGIKTEDLESVPDFALMGSATIEKVEQQRDELLEALKEAVAHSYNPFEPDNQCDHYKRWSAIVAKAEQ